MTSNIPSKYFIDDDSGLAINLPSQWSISPYLGAVKFQNCTTYSANIGIPQHVWEKVINNNRNKWTNAPESLFNGVIQNRPRIVISGFVDPRQAAWLMQNVLYSDDYDSAELIEDYLEMKYCSGSGEIWNDIISNIPSEFGGSLLTLDDEKKYFDKFDTETRKKIKIQKKNEIEYIKTMKYKIKREFIKLNLNLDSSELVDNFGIEYFVTKPGSVVLKNLNYVDFASI